MADITVAGTILKKIKHATASEAMLKFSEIK